MSENYFTITSTMLKEMHLEHANLLVYAVIKSHSAGFFGSRTTLTKLTNLSIRTIDNALNYLLEMHYIRKETILTTTNQVINKYYDNYNYTNSVDLNLLLNYITKNDISEFKDLFIKELCLENFNTLILRFRGLDKNNFKLHLEENDKYYKRQVMFWNQQNKTNYNLKYELYDMKGNKI